MNWLHCCLISCPMGICFCVFYSKWPTHTPSFCSKVGAIEVSASMLGAMYGLKCTDLANYGLSSGIASAHMRFDFCLTCLSKMSFLLFPVVFSKRGVNKTYLSTREWVQVAHSALVLSHELSVRLAIRGGCAVCFDAENSSLSNWTETNSLSHTPLSSQVVITFS